MTSKKECSLKSMHGCCDDRYKYLYVKNHSSLFFGGLFQRVFSILFILMLVLFGKSAYAACSGCNQTINLSINEDIAGSNNEVGYNMLSSTFTVGSINTGFTQFYKSTSFTKIDGSQTPYGTAPTTWVYQKIDDYLSVALRLSQKCGYIYAPFNRVNWSVETCQQASTNSIWESTTWQSSLRVDKKMVGGSYVKNILLGTWGGCDGGNCQSQDEVFARVYLNYNITVPQNCVINAGEIINVDFGNIPSNSFSAPGQRATNVTPASRQINMQCNNVDPSILLSVRIQADNVYNNAIVSDNSDVGFVIADSSGRELTPNLLNSTIPFKLASDGSSASVPINIWPVSVTGKIPQEGKVTALGYIRVDFQ